MLLSLFVIPTLFILVLFLGRCFTSSGMEWYKTDIVLPSITPQGWVFSLAWLVIYILSAVFLIFLWRFFERTRLFWATIALFTLNMICNVAWSYLFFVKHLIPEAFFVACILTFLVYLIIILTILQRSYLGILILPYALWGTFACYLNYQLWMLN